MLRSGFSTPEIIDATKEKQFVSDIGPQQVATLRAQGADDRLLGYLQTLPGYTVPPAPARKAATAAASAQAESSAEMAQATTPAPAPPDYAARDREIQALAARIEALDEQIRRTRTDPVGTLGWSSRYREANNRINQPAVTQNVDQLDKERDELRRRKWELEGR